MGVIFQWVLFFNGCYFFNGDLCWCFVYKANATKILERKKALKNDEGL